MSRENLGIASLWKVPIAAMAVSFCWGVAGTALVGDALAAFPGHNGKIAYVRTSDGRNAIYTMRSDGTHKRRLGRGTDPSFSADGKRIVFSQRRHGSFRSAIWIMMADGSQRRRLTHTRESDGGPAFSPSGRRIVFTRQRFQAGDPLGIDIYKMRADGSGVHRITRTGNSAARGWSPDGSHILAEVGSTVTLLKPDGSNAEPVVEPPPGAFDQGPDLAPSGRRIVFARDYDDPRRLQIYIVRTDGTHLRRIDNSPAHDQEPVFAPSGGRIAFESDRRRPHGTFEICTMRADGSNVTRLTRAYPRASAGLPSWGVRP